MTARPRCLKPACPAFLLVSAFRFWFSVLLPELLTALLLFGFLLFLLPVIF